MSSGFSGDLGEMGELEENLRQLAEVPARASKRAAEGISELIQKQFDEGCDPYGNPWAPLRPATLARGRFPPPLTDTTSLRSGIEVVPMRGAGISITIEDGEIANFHQNGTAKMAARPILPNAGMPPAWEEVLSEAVAEAFSTTMKVRAK